MATTNSTTQPMGLAPAMNLQLQGQTLKNMDCVAVDSPPPPLWLHAGLAQSSPLMPNSAPCPHGFCTNKEHSTSSDAQFQTNPPPFTSALTSTPEANGGSDYEMIRQEYYPESYTAAFTGFQTCSFMNMEPFLDQQYSPTGPQASIEFTGKLDLVEECASPDLSQNKIGPICTIATKNERRKAQNRRAQRAFRIRQQKALYDATIKMQSMQEELKNAVTAKENFERLFTELSGEHERLVAKLGQILVSPHPSHLVCPDDDSLFDTKSE